MSDGGNRRLDAAIVASGAFPSRARAQAAIRAGLVSVNGQTATKPGASVSGEDAIEVAGDIHDFVSRGALKLEAALDAFNIDPRGRICLDLGASTGGFTEVLLRSGAASVYAVDVGSGQLHPRIAADDRVVNLERTHARDLGAALVPDPPEVIVADVSFISLKKALPQTLTLAAADAVLVALVKPQFEVGPENIGKGGIVRDSPENAWGVAEDIRDWLACECGWRPLGVIESPIAGGDGNREFLVGATRSA